MLISTHKKQCQIVYTYMYGLLYQNHLSWNSTECHFCKTLTKNLKVKYGFDFTFTVPVMVEKILNSPNVFILQAIGLQKKPRKFREVNEGGMELLGKRKECFIINYFVLYYIYFPPVYIFCYFTFGGKIKYLGKKNELKMLLVLHSSYFFPLHFRYFYFA